ncbi:MAG: matrixin family metalloprotease [Methanosarcinales archaeon]|nr:matrixin family metalloprotease [Methanosarcinales archaeon]
MKSKILTRLIMLCIILCIILALAGTMAAYNLTDSYGSYYKWNKNYSNPIYVDSSNLNSSWKSATVNAINMWNTGSNDANISLVNQSGRIECMMSAVPITDRHALAFVNYSTYTYYPSNQTFVISGIILRVNTSYTNWYTGTGTSSNNYSLQSVIAHELGHVLGLHHDDSYTNGLMRTTIGMGVARTVGSDEIAGLRAIYGRR